MPGDSPGEDDHGDSRQTATPIALREVVHGRLDSDDDIDYFRFKVTREEGIAVWEAYPFQGQRHVFDATGAEIQPLSVDPVAGVTQYRLSAGEYFLRVSFKDFLYPGSYTFGAIEDVQVEIPDEELRDAIGRAFRRLDTPLRSGNIAATITSFGLDEGGAIRDLTGLEWAVRLHTLEIRGHEISDIAPLSGLTELRDLRLSRNRITNIEPLSRSGSLEVLWINGNGVVDLSPLSGATALEHLAISDNGIADLSVLRDTRHLKSLGASHNRIKDISALEDLASLGWLNLNSNRIADVSSLRAATALGSLYLADNGIADIEPLRQLTALRHLNIGGNHVEDLSALRDLSDLKTLDIRHNPLSSASADVHIPAMQAAGVSVTWMSGDRHGDTRETSTPLHLREAVDGTISPYYDTDFFRLELDEAARVDVFTYGNGVLHGRLMDSAGLELASDNTDASSTNFRIRRDLTPGTYFVEVTAAYIPTQFPSHYKLSAAPDVVDVEIPDPSLRAALEVLLIKHPGEVITSAELGLLRRLTLKSRGIVDLTGLEFATGLTELYLENNAIVNVSPLAGLTELRRLDLGGNEIIDISPIVDVPNLEWLNVSNNPLGRESLDVHLPTLRDNGVFLQDFGDEQGDDPGSAMPIVLGDVVRSRIDPHYDVDVFRLDLDRPRKVGFVVMGSFVAVRLLDEAQTLVQRGERTIRGHSKVYLIQRTLDAGTYYIEVTTPGGNRSWYTLRAIDAVDVELVDANLRGAVEASLGKAAGAPVTAAEMATIIEFRACCDIAELAGLEFAVALEELNLSQNDISDISPVAALTELTRLNLAHNRIADVSPLAALTRLQFLDLSSNDVVDVSPLAELPVLENLQLADNRIRDVAPLQSLDVLTTLDLGGNEIEDISALTALPRLRTVLLFGNPLSQESIDEHVPALTGRGIAVGYRDDHGNVPEAATELFLGQPVEAQIWPYHDEDWFELRVTRALDIAVETRNASVRLFDEGGAELARGRPTARHDTFSLNYRVSPGKYYLQVTDDSGRGSYYEIVAAEIVAVPDDDLRALLRDKLGRGDGEGITTLDLASITELNANGSGIRDLTGLEFASRLSTLYLERNRISDLSPIAALPGLQLLFLSGNDIADLSPLAGLTELAQLSLARNAITDLKPLAGKARLAWLDLSDNRVSDISTLAGLVSLAYLYLDGNTIADISALADLTALWELRMSHNAISNVSPLAGLSKLYRLTLVNNRIVDISTLAELTALGHLDLRRNPLNPEAADIAAEFALRGVNIGAFDAHGDRPETATPLVLGEKEQGRLEPSDDRDYFRLEVFEETDAVFYTTGDLGTRGALLDAENRNVRVDHHATGPGGNFMFAHQLSPGVYHVLVSALYRSDYGAKYELWARPNAVELPDPALRRVLPGDGLGGESVKLTDLARATGLAAPGVAISDLSGLEFALNLEVLVLNDNAVVDISPLLGMQSLQLVDLRGNPLGEDAVELHIPALRRKGVLVVTEDDHGDNPAAATSLSANRQAVGLIYPISETDYFRIRVPHAADVTLFTAGESDTMGRLFGAAGQLIAEDDNGGEQRNFRIERSLAPGVYDLEVTASGAYRPGSLLDSLLELLAFAPYVVHAKVVMEELPPAHVSAELDDTELLVVWNAFAGNYVTGYRVDVTAVGGGETRQCEAAPVRRRCLFEGLAAGETYEVTVTALGGDGTPPMVTTLSEPAGTARSMWRGWRLELLRGLTENPEGEP